MLTRDPNKRPSTSEILQHPWILPISSTQMLTESFSNCSTQGFITKRSSDVASPISYLANHERFSNPNSLICSSNLVSGNINDHDKTNGVTYMSSSFLHSLKFRRQSMDDEHLKQVNLAAQMKV